MMITWMWPRPIPTRAWIAVGKEIMNMRACNFKGPLTSLCRGFQLSCFVNSAWINTVQRKAIKCQELFRQCPPARLPLDGKNISSENRPSIQRTKRCSPVCALLDSANKDHVQTHDL